MLVKIKKYELTKGECVLELPVEREILVVNNQIVRPNLQPDHIHEKVFVWVMGNAVSAVEPVNFFTFLDGEEMHSRKDSYYVYLSSVFLVSQDIVAHIFTDSRYENANALQF